MGQFVGILLARPLKFESAFLVSAGHNTAIDIPDSACYPSSFVEKQKCYGIGNIFGGAYATDRMKAVE